jgi:protocatechuate 3,4-dioxygenase beta subunit
MSAAKRWGIIVAVVVALAALWWLWAGRGAGEAGLDDASANSSGGEQRGGAATSRTRGGEDSTAKLLASNKATIRGTVRDPGGRAVAGATVCAWPDESELRGAAEPSPSCVETEADGRYRIEGLWPVSTRVSASAPSYQPGRWSERVEGRRRFALRLRAGQERGDIDLILEPGGVAIRGVVKDISGGVIEGALVSASKGWWFGANGRAVARTDEDGRFELWAEPGVTSLQARAEGYADASTSSAAPSELAEIFMTPASSITGVVVHAKTGAPVAGATVSARSGNFFQSGAGSALTDDEGQFRLLGLEPGAYELSAGTDELYGEAAERISLGLAEVGAATIRVHPAVALRGRVVVVETGEPCTGGSVTLSGDDFDGRGAIGEDGEVLIRALLPGEYRVSLSCSGHAPESSYDPIIVAEQPLEEVEWAVHTGLAIRGLVVDPAGEGVAAISINARVKAKPGDDPRGQRTSQWGERTEPDGSFELAGLLPGTYELSVWSEDRPRPREPTVVELAAGSDAEDVRVVLPATGRLEGIVRDDAGEPAAGVSVSTSLADAPSNQRTTTGDDGRFRFDHVHVGQHRVTAQAGWFNSMRAPGTTDDDVQGETVSVSEGGTAQVELVVERRRGVIRGRVVDADGGPVSDAFIDAERMSDSAAAGVMGSRFAVRWSWDRQPVLSDHDGGFELRDLSEGNYLVRAYREGGGEALAEGISAGSRDVVLTIVETGSIAGKVTLAAGGSPERFEIKTRDRAAGFMRTDNFFRTEGAFALRELPPGRYELTFSTGKGSAKLEVELAAGEAVDDLEVELAAKVKVTGRLIDADTRAPVSGQRVSISADNSFAFMFDEGAGGELRDVSDGDGRFEVTDAPTGKVTLSVRPRDLGSDSDYAWTSRTIVLAGEPETQDIGEIELHSSRLARREKAGDLGFKLQPSEPDEEPEDATHVVAVVRPGGPAANAGLKVGDRIVEVDGRTVSGLDSHRYRTLVRAPPGTVLELTLDGDKDGDKTVSLELGPPLEW